MPALRQLRLAQGRTLKQVASQVGITGEGLGVIERRRSCTAPEIQARIAAFYGTSVDEIFEPAPVIPDGLLSQTEAIARAGVSVGQWYHWRRQRRIAPIGTTTDASSRIVLFQVADVDEVASWGRRSITETEAMRRARVGIGTLRILRDSGELGEWREHGGQREYDREGVQRYVRKRARLMSMRAYCRAYGLPMWVMLRLVAEGLVKTLPGPKGGKLVDPLELKSLLHAKACEVCGDLIPPGRSHHSACVNRTSEGRTRCRRQIRVWWASPAADAWREKKMDLSCPNCGRAFERPESWIRAIGKHRPEQAHVFCSQTCSAEYRWKNGLQLEALLSTMPGRVRQRWSGRWHGHRGAIDGHKGAAHGRKGITAGIEASWTNWGRPSVLTGEEQQLIYKLHKHGLSSRDISLKVWGTPQYKDRVLRYLRR
jgi:transcriptional regulator with XRE-family HTH domain